PSTDSEHVFEMVKGAYGSRFALDWTEPLGFNDTFAIIVRRNEAQRLCIKTISQAAPYTSKWTKKFGYEFMQREDGYPSVAKIYNLRFPASPRVMDLGLTYKAAAERQVDFIAGNSTDGLIDALGLTVLEDDKHYFAPYDAAPVIRDIVVRNHPEVR